MSFEELLPTVQDQAYFAVLRYDPRRQDKIQELCAMSYEMYLSDTKMGRDITRQKYKQFITKRARELDTRSVVKKGYGGNSKLDPLGFYRRRPSDQANVVEFSDWLSFDGNAGAIENNYNFQIDFKEFFAKLSELQQKVFNLRAEGYVLKEIAKMLKVKVDKVFNLLKEIRAKFMRYFGLE